MTQLGHCLPALGDQALEPLDETWTCDRLARLTAQAVSSSSTPAEDLTLILGFSGGADSAALLLALLSPQLETTAPGTTVLATHVDHELDSHSGERAQEAARLFDHVKEIALDQPDWRQITGRRTVAQRSRFVSLRSSEATQLPQRPAENHGVEANARRLRYRLLEDLRKAENGKFVLTAHHADDQLETLILRIRQNTRIDGLKGIQRRRGKILRPFLSTRSEPGLEHGPSSEDLRNALRGKDISWIEDPTNRELKLQRNAVRRSVLPALRRREDSGNSMAHRAQALALRAQSACSHLDQKLTHLLSMELHEPEEGVLGSLNFDLWLTLPEPVQDAALNTLHRLAGHHYGPTRAARQELRRQSRQRQFAAESRQRQIALKPSQHQVDAEATKPHGGPERCSSTGNAIGCACGSGLMWRTKVTRGAGEKQLRLHLLSQSP